MRRHVLLLDLKDDPALIAEYEAHHAAGKVWPEVVDSIRQSGIQSMTIHRLGTRLVMLVEADDDFDFAAKGAADSANPVVQRWEALMDRFQQPIAADPSRGKWQRATEIFSLDAQ
ncbi:L-rhamnose mutarotase [Sphingomonas sp. ASV193]|uniref:L-rhamnose mutarotase n=1 Tax=Sphingomonas sp. ASV193 TaxID=3144405 RepID=UPI0032E909BF